MKLAIIGSGNIVHDFLTITKDLKDTELTAIIGTTRSLDILKQLQDQYHIKEVYTDFDEALAKSDFDTVYVAVPNFLHYAFAKRLWNTARMSFPRNHLQLNMKSLWICKRLLWKRSWF